MEPMEVMVGSAVLVEEGTSSSGYHTFESVGVMITSASFQG